MKLNELIKDLNIVKKNFKDINIKNISLNSKLQTPDFLFIAVKGNNTDGNNYIQEAINNGCVAVLTEKKDIDYNIPILISNDISKDMAIIARRFFDFPDKNMCITGITGTNGKTTISYFLKSIYDTKYKSGLIGTIRHLIDNEIVKALNTTPDSITLFRLLNQMRKRNCKYVVMEVSSHALKLNRVFSMEFDAALFTNLTQDHLDFHLTMEDYKQSKLKLFTMLKKNGFAVINADDKHYKDFINILDNNKYYTLGLRNKDAQWTINIKKINMEGSEYQLKHENSIFDISINIIGDYNIYNSSMAFITAFYQGFSPNDIINGLKNIKNVPGRFDKLKDKRGFYVIIDYAHTPDALERVIKTTKRLTKGRVITVFGCGGDRDKSKRPIMGKIASHYSDLVILTSDNPRTEDPEEIIEQIEQGICEDNYFIEINRAIAIKKAIERAVPNDTVIIAGKGHENYQIIGNKKFHFDDKEEVLRYLK